MIFFFIFLFADCMGAAEVWCRCVVCLSGRFWITFGWINMYLKM